MTGEGWQHRPGISMILVTQVHPNRILMRGNKTFADMGAMSPRMKALAAIATSWKVIFRYISVEYKTSIWQCPAASSMVLIGLKFISKILHITHSQWIFRIFSLHDNRNGYLHKKKVEEIALELESLAGLAPEDVPTHSRFLLEINFSNLNKSNLESQMY
jgi:hypothetical protein